MANASAIILIIILLAIIFYFFGNRNFSETEFQSTTSTTSTTSSSAAINQPNFLRRKYYIDISSGKGLTWFGNSTINDIRTAFSDWQNAENNFIQFYEVNDSSADITIKFVSGINQSVTTKTIGETYVSVGLIKGSIQIVPQGVPCRNVGIIEHELGHIIGLEHNETNRFDIMYPLQSYGCDQSISDFDVQQARNFIEQLIS
jgi:predicted Zn-dependent protease